jgi:heat shock protein HspQ
LHKTRVSGCRFLTIKLLGGVIKPTKNKMAKEAKFKIGDLVRHKAAQKHNARKMIVTATGSLKNEDGETTIYQLSGEKESYVAKDDTFFRVILEEIEIELFDK